MIEWLLVAAAWLVLIAVLVIGKRSRRRMHEREAELREQALEYLVDLRRRRQ